LKSERWRARGKERKEEGKTKKKGDKAWQTVTMREKEYRKGECVWL
jgi:hypothetical protein